MSEHKRVLFVCMGNICRSPTGEGVMWAMVERRGLGDRITVDSAGTIGYHAGEPADGRMRQHAAERGYSLDSTARQVTLDDLDTFDLVIAMDRDNLADLQALAGGPRDHVRMLGSFLEDHTDDTAPDVPDPYYGGAAGFERVIDMIESACPAIIEHLLGGNGRAG